MPLVDVSYRKPHRLIAEERNKKAREDNPKPISMVGGGRGSALTAFAQGSGAVDAR